MDASTTAGPLSQSLEMPPWKTAVSHVSAAFVALIFLVAGVYKAVDPYGVARLFEELLVPYQVSLPLVVALAVGEMFSGVLVLVPRFRRWGAVLTSLLLVAFMAYIGIHYNSLVGKDCSCFPWIKRTVGPMFFVGDAAFLAAALLAGFWGQPVTGRKRTAAVVLGAVAVFTGVSFGSAMAHLTGTKAPDTITVDGKPYSLEHGRIFVFFFDPECSHCNDAARHMSTYHWKSDVSIVGIPTRVPQFGEAFMHDNHLKGVISLDLQKMKAVFPFGDPPFGVALDNGREVGPVSHYDDEDNGAEPAASLRKLGYID